MTATLPLVVENLSFRYRDRPGLALILLELTLASRLAFSYQLPVFSDLFRQ